MAETKPPCYCGRNDETGYMELCPEHEGEMFDHMMDTDRISALQAQLAARDQQIARLREALESVQWGDERYCDDPARPESGVLYKHCPDCGNSEDDGRHAEGCIVGIALADTPAVEPDPRDQQIARLTEANASKAALK